MSMQVNQNITPFLGGKSTGRTCTICSDRFNQKSLRVRERLKAQGTGPVLASSRQPRDKLGTGRQRAEKNNSVYVIKNSMLYALCPMRSDLALRTRFSMLNKVLDLNGS
jgi:hypothetical protein